MLVGITDYFTECGALEKEYEAKGMRFHFLDSLLKPRDFSLSVYSIELACLYLNCPVGLVGLGRIGSATALRLKAFGFILVGYDPYAPTGIEKVLGVLQQNIYRNVVNEIQQWRFS